MKIELLSMKLTNAKGVKHFEFEPDGNSVLVAGDNGTGKTTILDSYLWLMFDKDSSGRKGFEAIKTTEGTDFAHNLTHEVEATISVDGRKVMLRKSLEEKWTKPRGKSEHRFDGHETSYYVNDIPRSMREFQAEIDQMLDRETFQVLTDPVYFSTQLHWKERLKILTDIAGEVTLEDIAGDNPRLQSLVSELIEDRISIDDYRKRTHSQKLKVDDDIKKLPIRIDEVTRSRPADEDWSVLEAEIEAYKQKVERIDKQISSASEALEPILQAQRELMAVENEKQLLIREKVEQANNDRFNLNAELEQAAKSLRIANDDKDTAFASVQQIEADIERSEKRIQEHRSNFQELKAEQRDVLVREFQAPDLFDDVCLHCGQPLPEERIQEHLQSAREAFEKAKEKDLKAIEFKLNLNIEEGKEESERIKRLSESLTKKLQDYDDAQMALVEAVNRKRAIEVKLENPELAIVTPDKFEQDPDVQALDLKINSLKIKVSQTPEQRTDELLEVKRIVQLGLEERQRLLRNKELAEQADIRLEQLQAELNRAAVMQAEFEGKLQDCDDFVRAKTATIEGSINSLFTQVGFKLFSEQINGGVSETCEAVIGETTYGKANTAAQINAGLDIIETISDHMGIRVPVFVDRLESNLHLYPISSQVIALQVAPHALTVSNLE